MLSTLKTNVKAAIATLFVTAAPAAAAWIEQNNAAGLPAQELYDLVTGMVAKGM